MRHGSKKPKGKKISSKKRYKRRAEKKKLARKKHAHWGIQFGGGGNRGALSQRFDRRLQGGHQKKGYSRMRNTFEKPPKEKPGRLVG